MADVYLVDNPNLKDTKDDMLFHFGIDPNAKDHKDIYGDTKFVIVGGAPNRMESMAKSFSKELHQLFPDAVQPVNLSKTDRYALYKFGPIIFANHGIGVDSMSVAMNELLKLLHYAECKGVVFFRCGTSGGIGVDPGTVVITNEPVNGLLEPWLEQYVLLKRIRRSTTIDVGLATALKEQADDLGVPSTLGKTMGCRGFYEEQARLNGALCEYAEKDYNDFLQQLYDHGVRNMEMESGCFASMLNRVNVKGAVLCVALLNRFKGDLVTGTNEEIEDWELRPGKIVLEYIKKQCREAV